MYFVAPAPGFTAKAAQPLTVWVAKGFYEQSVLDPHGPHGPGDVVITASVAGCAAPVTADIHSDGMVSPQATNPHTGEDVGGYLWTVTLDLSSCQDAGTRVHHCDGCGRTFDTCDGGASRALTLVVDAFNQPGNSMCTLHDWNADGVTDCDTVGGTLAGGAAGGATELWVPAKFWTADKTCVSRADDNGACHPIANQGGNSCQ